MAKWTKRAEIIDALASLGERFLVWFLLVMGTLGFGGAGAWVATASQWLDAYGPIAWWGSGLLSALVFVLLMLLAAMLRKRWAEYQFIRAQRQKTEDINPLDDTFEKRLININIFRTPILEWIVNKTFIDCKILGPAVIAFGGDGYFKDTHLKDCDLVIIRNDAPVRNAIAFKNTTAKNCTFYNMTILVPEAMKPAFDKIKGITWITKQTV